MQVSNEILKFGSLYHLQQQKRPAPAALQGLATGISMGSKVDDASALVAARRMRTQIAELSAADNSISFEPVSGTGDDIFDAADALLDRMAELARKALVGGMDADRYELNAEYQKLAQEMQGLKDSRKDGPLSYTQINFGQAGSSGPDPNDPSAVTLTGKNYSALLGAIKSHIQELSAAAGPEGLSAEAKSRAAADFVRQHGQSLLDTEEGAGSADVSITISGGNIYLHDNVSLDNIDLSNTDLLTQGGAESALEAIKAAKDDIQSQRDAIKAFQEEIAFYEAYVAGLHAETVAFQDAQMDANMVQNIISTLREQASLQATVLGVMHRDIEAEDVSSLVTL